MKAVATPEVGMLSEYLIYCPATGVFIWRYRPGGKHSGKTAGSASKQDGYRRLNILGKRYLAHRLAWKLTFGSDAEEIDHINGIRDDNRIANLRAVSRRQNQRNKAGSGPCSKGVYFNKKRGKFVAQIKAPGAKQYLGSFDTEKEASDAYAIAAEKHFGPYDYNLCRNK